MIKRAASMLLFLAGCQPDLPHPVAPPGALTPVDRLSQLGIFEEPLREQRPMPGIIPYDVNVSLYSDGASKHRFFYLPPGTSLRVAADRWTVPLGTYFIKSFYYPVDARDPSLGERLIETRFLIRTASGYQASTYLWNDEQTDAVASGGNLDRPTSYLDAAGTARRGYFHVPGTSLCMSCHQDRALGLRSRQMDKGDQIDRLIALGALDASPSPRAPLADPFGSAPLPDRARSYLDANCAHCHAQQGEASNTGLFWDLEDTGAGQLPLCRPTPSIDGRDHVIVPGSPERSEFLARMLSPDAFVRMPQGPTHIPDAAAIAVLTEWVKQMAPAGCP